MIDLKLLKDSALQYGVSLNACALERMDKYAQALIDTNQHINLTAITEPIEVLYKHFVDSLTVLSVCHPTANASWIDVGTGAGFPGAVLLAARPDLQMTFLDGTKKKLLFIENTLNRIDLPAHIIHARAEEAGQNPIYRERFDYVSARAVANLRELTEYCLPFLRLGGTFVAMKSLKSEDELEQAKSAIQRLGGKIERIEGLTLPNGENRTLILIQKISHTPTKYPRPSAKIAKQPLK